MAAMLADNVEEEYLWATSLTSAKKVQQVLMNLECSKSSHMLYFTILSSACPYLMHLNTGSRLGP